MADNQSFCSFLPATQTNTRRGRNKKTKKRTTGPSFVSSTVAPLAAAPKATQSSRQKAFTSVVPRAPPRARIAEKKKIDAREYNIFHIDSIIRDQLNSQISSVPELEKDLENALRMFISGTPNDQVMAQQQSSVLRRRIQDLESTFELSYYVLRTADILEEYRKTMLSKSSRSFVCLDRDEADRETTKRDEFVTKYLLVAREYVEIENYQQQTKKMICPACYNTDMRRSDEETTFVCTLCATEVQILDDTPSFKDTDRVNMCSRYTYSRKGHFVDAIKKHQGKQNADPEVIQSVISILLEEMGFHNLTVDTAKKHHLYMFLSERELSAHYDDLNLLHHIITDEPCPDISMYEQQLLEDFDEQEGALDKVYEEDINDTRVNSLNVYYKLYKLLQRCGHNCRKDDFYILKTKTKEDEHDEKMKKAWRILGWEWIETF